MLSVIFWGNVICEPVVCEQSTTSRSVGSSG